MELKEAVNHILDGDAVIIMGAGASYGAQNSFGAFPSGPALAKILYEKCEIEPEDENDLQDASACYEEHFSANQLISEIKTLLYCTQVTEAQEVIYSLPWMRCYTTNYDEVPIIASGKQGKRLIPVTIDTDVKRYGYRHDIVVYINGYIGTLSESTLHNTFKLTAQSYYSSENIVSSKWGALLSNDLDTAKCIVILGVSMRYDLDLGRILFSNSYKEKTIIIDKPNLSENAENKLSRFGSVYKLGIDEFAKTIGLIKSQYSPRNVNPENRLYSAFEYNNQQSPLLEKPSEDRIFDLVLNGNCDHSLFYKECGLYAGIVKRTVVDSIIRDISENKRFIFIHSDMGNGKTICTEILNYELSLNGINVYNLSNPDSSKLNDEINAICTLAQSEQVVVIIDDYNNYRDVLKRFRLIDNGAIQYILTARSALNLARMPDIIEDFNLCLGESTVYDINRLDSSELDACVEFFDRHGLFGEHTKLTRADKLKHLSRSRNGASKFQSIMLDLLKSSIMQRKVGELINIIKYNNQYHNSVLLILLVNIMNLRLNALDIERICGISVFTDARFQSDPAIKELIMFGKHNELKLKSPVTARFILNRIAEPDSIISTMCNLAHYSTQYEGISKYDNILKTIISYSHIHSFLNEIKKPEQFLSAYYEEISRLDYYRNNNFFWLQYAIACIETKRYERAQQYLTNAYGLCIDGFEAFQINNQQARLYLERIMNDDTSDPVGDFSEAHHLLMKPITSAKDNEYYVVKLFSYYTKKKIRQILKKSDNMEMYINSCKEAYKRIEAFLHRKPNYKGDLEMIQVNLIKTITA